MGVAAVSAISVRIARGFAVKRALLDHPNERSSHSVPVPRFGGAAIVPVLLLGLVVLGPAGPTRLAQLVFVGGAFALYLVGLIDDVRPLSTGVRFAAQFLVAGALLAATRTGWAVGGDLPLAVGALLLAVAIVATINIYNFMDGIDGIAGVQAVVAGIGWAIIGTIVGSPVAVMSGSLTAAAALGFLTLNWPPAKIFMGDAGSTVLGFVFASLPLIAISCRVPEVRNLGIPEFQNSRMLIAGGLMVFPFLIDGVFTIFRRLSRQENIFKAHRSHVYQRLVLSGLSHQTVTLVYGAVALVGAAAGIAVVVGPLALAGVLMVACVLAFGALWRWAVCREARAKLNRGGS